MTAGSHQMVPEETTGVKAGQWIVLMTESGVGYARVVLPFNPVRSTAITVPSAFVSVRAGVCATPPSRNRVQVYKKPQSVGSRVVMFVKAVAFGRVSCKLSTSAISTFLLRETRPT